MPYRVYVNSGGNVKEIQRLEPINYLRGKRRGLAWLTKGPQALAEARSLRQEVNQWGKRRGTRALSRVTPVIRRRDGSDLRILHKVTG